VADQPPVSTEPDDQLSQGRAFRDLIRRDDFKVVQLKKHMPERDTYLQGVCASWELTIEGIRSFLSEAVPITGPEWHYGYDWYDCKYTGTLQVGVEWYEFTIDAGGSGHVSSPATNAGWTVGCTRCHRLLPRALWYAYGQATAGTG
jgi:hypothetical protein